jgi:fermentation-respiration switch protein FrsA (DUF1100 family)
MGNPPPRRRAREALAVLLLRDVPFWVQSPRRRALRLVAALAYTYVGVLLVLLALENRFLFPASSAREEWFDPPAHTDIRDVELPSADGNTIHAWWIEPPGWSASRGAVLYSHGNGGNLSGRGLNIARWSKELGRAVLIYDYPGYGKSSGRPTEAGCYAAGEAGYRHLVEGWNVPAKETIQLGSSLGGGIATELATRHDCRMLILCSPFTSVPDMAQKMFPWLPARWLARNKFNNLAKIDKVGCPVFIAHGTADTLVPFWMGERLYAQAREPKAFLRLEGFYHAHPHQAEFFEAVRGFLGRTN